MGDYLSQPSIILKIVGKIQKRISVLQTCLFPVWDQQILRAQGVGSNGGGAREDTR